MKSVNFLFAITTVLLLVLGISTAEAKSLRRSSGQRKLEDYYNNYYGDDQAAAADDAAQGDDAAGDDAANAGDDNVQEGQEEEEEQGDDGAVEEDVQDNSNGGQNSNSGYNNNNHGSSSSGGILDTTPRNWEILDWVLVAGLFLIFGALTSCLCEAWWCCTCLRSAEEKLYENRKLPAVIKDPTSTEAYCAM